jgi:hypothetical protein
MAGGMHFLRTTPIISEIFEIMNNPRMDDELKAKEINELLVKFSERVSLMQRKKCAAVIRKFCLDYNLPEMVKKVRDTSGPVILE